MLLGGIIFVLSPIWLYLLDRADILPRTFDPLSWSLALGIIGIVMIVADQSRSRRRALIAGLIAFLVLIAGIYGVAAEVVRVNF